MIIIPPEIPLLYNIILGIVGFFFCMKLSIVLLMSVKNCDGILMGTALNVYVAFGRIANFTMLILPIHEHGRSYIF